MTVHVALQTLAKIEDTIRADQGSSYRGWLGKVIPHIGDAYREGKEGFRTHLGASLVGAECARAIWYGFRWTTKGDHTGRLMRLFNRGHLEEARFIAILLTIGCTVYQQDENGKQFRISGADGHFGGSGDGVVIGLPELATGTAALAEFKTHSEKSFIELAGTLKEWREYCNDPEHLVFPGKGVREAKFEHFVQMQVYMRKMGLSCALYMAVNKNTDDLYAEIIPLDAAIADQYIDRGEKIVWLKEAPKGISNSAGFFKCRFCDHNPVCHKGHAPHLNCRTCEHSHPVEAGQWVCTVGDDHGAGPDIITPERAQTGCELYRKSHAI